MLSTGQSLYYGQRRTQDARVMLERLLAAHSLETTTKGLKLNQHHPTLFQAHVDLINICDAMDDAIGSLAHCRAVCESASLVLPPNYLETSNYWYYLGMICLELIQKNPNRKADCNEWHRQRVSAFTRCWEMRKIWFGADHPYALKAHAKIAPPEDQERT